MINSEDTQDLKKGLNWTIALGIVLVLMGLGAIVSPFVAAVFVTIILGWMFVVGGILRGIDAIRSRYERSFVWQLLISILYVVLGMLILTNLFSGVLSLTLLIGIFIFIQGVFEVILAFQIRPSGNWIWVLLSGLINVILGILIWSKWPVGAAWILGVLVGVSLLTTGISVIMFAIAARHVIREATLDA